MPSRDDVAFDESAYWSAQFLRVALSAQDRRPSVTRRCSSASGLSSLVLVPVLDDLRQDPTGDHLRVGGGGGIPDQSNLLGIGRELEHLFQHQSSAPGCCPS